MLLQSHPLQSTSLPLIHALTGPNGPAIEMRTEDGYINATLMCKAAGKFWPDFNRLSNTQAFLSTLASVMGIPMTGLVHSRQGGLTQGTWVHPQLAIKLAAWCSAEFEVAVTDLVLRYSRGDVTTEESKQAAEQLIHAGASQSWKPHGVGGVSNDLRGNQVYLGLPEGNFSSIRSMGSKPSSENADTHELTNTQSEPVLVKFGRSDDLPQRTKCHAAAFGGFKLLDHFEVSDPSAAEKRLKRRLDAVGRRVRAKHTGKGKEDFELVQVADQGQYEELYNLALWACTDPDESATVREKELTKRVEVEWGAKRDIAVEQEKTEQARIELQKAQAHMNHEWRMRQAATPVPITDKPDATALLEEFAQSGRLVYEPGAYMKLADLRDLGDMSGRISMDALQHVFTPRGVTFSVKSRRMIPGTKQACNTLWADGVRAAA